MRFALPHRALRVSLVLAIAIGALATTPPASAAPVLSGTNATALTIPAEGTAGPATPYPSDIEIPLWCQGGTITDVNISLFGMNHTFSDDIDVLLVGPGGQNAFVMGDAGGAGALVDVDVTLDDEAMTPLGDTGISSGVYQPANHVGDGTDTFADPAPMPSGGSALSVFDGTSPLGTWSLYVMDDEEGDSGTIDGGWSLSITVTAAGTETCIEDLGPAEPYPSTRTVSGLAGTVGDVNLLLEGLSHSWPGDMDILLVGPGGQNALVMSDVAGGNALMDVTLTLDDEAMVPLPPEGVLPTGSYQPANYDGSPDVFDPPAPAPGGGVALSTFDGTNPNGAWSLYIMDQVPEDEGVLTDWSLDFTLIPPPPVPPPPPPPVPVPPLTVTGKKAAAAEGKALKFTVSRAGGEIGQSLSLPFTTKGKTAKPRKDFKKASGTLTFAPGQTSALVKVKTINDAIDEKNEKLLLKITLPGGAALRIVGAIKDND